MRLRCAASGVIGSGLGARIAGIRRRRMCFGSERTLPSCVWEAAAAEDPDLVHGALRLSLAVAKHAGPAALPRRAQLLAAVRVHAGALDLAAPELLRDATFMLEARAHALGIVGGGSRPGRAVSHAATAHAYEKTEHGFYEGAAHTEPAPESQPSVNRSIMRIETDIPARPPCVWEWRMLAWHRLTLHLHAPEPFPPLRRPFAGRMESSMRTACLLVD